MNRVSLAGIASAFGLSLPLVLAGCATTPGSIPEVDEARMLLQRLENQPKAQQVAGGKLIGARDALLRAETALADGEPLEQVRHDAYVARRQAEIGIELTLEAEALENLLQAERFRNELRLRARTLEAERARSLADQRAAEAEQSRALAEAALAEADELAKELAAMEAEQTARGLVLTLSDVLFDTGQAGLKEGAVAAIDRLARFMNDNAERNLMIEGHTDSRGSEVLNTRLSARRAAAVGDALTQRGIAKERLRTVGLGEAYPVASNDTEAGMQQNRRVEIVVSDRDGTFPEAAERRLQPQG